MNKLKIIKISYHRNGISGMGFYAILFKDLEDNPKDLKIASLFDEKGYCAVYSVDELKKENIEFANGNSWRGDAFEDDLRKAVKEQKKTNRVVCFSLPQKEV